MLAHVPSFGQKPRCLPDFLAYPVPKACMHVLGTGVPSCFGVAFSASSPKAAQALGCSLTPLLRILFAWSPAWHGLPQCPGYGHWVSYRWVALVFGSRFRGNPANPGLGLGCVYLGTGLGFVPFHSIPGSGLWSVCLGLGFGLHPAIPGWGFWGVCGCARAPPVPCLSWPGCAVWLCVLELGFQLRPATPGWAVGVCVCLCARSACTPALLAGVRGVGMCALARASGASRDVYSRLMTLSSLSTPVGPGVRSSSCTFIGRLHNATVAVFCCVRGYGCRRPWRTMVSPTRWTPFLFGPLHALVVWCLPACG